MFKRVFNFLVYGGGTRLRPYEQRLMTLAQEALPDAEQHVLAEQLARVQRFKRYNDGRMVTFQFDGVDAPLFADVSPDLPLVSFAFDGSKKKAVAGLVAHRGRIHSLEFKQKPTDIAPERWEHIVARYRGPSLDVAEAIDREEHG